MQITDRYESAMPINRSTSSTNPNQKLWITGIIRTELKGRAAAFKEQDSNLEVYKKSRYAR